MRSLCDALARLFLEPQVAEAPAPAAEAPQESGVRWLPPQAAPSLREEPSAVHVGIVCSGRDARVCGGALALAILYAGAGRAAAVLEWDGASHAPGHDRPAAPAARRLAAAWRDGDHAARAAGRLVRVTLPAAEDAAAGEARALIGRSPVPTALVVAGPRGAMLEEVLAEQDRIVLAHRRGADAGAVALAAAGLEALGPPAVTLEVPGSPGAAVLARNGTGLVAPLRAPFLAAVGEAHGPARPGSVRS